MPTEQEVKQFVQGVIDREHYSDYLIYVRENKGEINVTAKKIHEQTAQELIDSC